MEPKVKLLRITTVPVSLNVLLRGQLAYVRSKGFDVITASAGGEEIDELVKREGVAHHIIPLTRKITPYQDFVSLWKLVAFIKKEKIQIVHSHTPKAGLIAMLAARIAGVRYRLHTVAGMPLMEASGIKRILLKFTEKVTYWCSTRVYPNSYRLMDFIKTEISNSQNKFHVIANGSSNGIDTVYFRSTKSIVQQSELIKEQLGLSKNDFVLTFIGRIVSDKGINELVEAFITLQKECSRSIKLLLVGPYENDLNPIYRTTKESINDHPDIISVGFQEDVRPYFALTDLFVFPSYREGFPNVVLQSCAMGVPCIVSDINGCNEIIRHKETGLLVPAKDVNCLKKAMEEMIDNEELRNKFAEKGRKNVVLHYDQKYVWDQIITEYRSMIKDV
ncbi:glycosyltransferase family 4 protein [Fulvivirga sp. 29W222]|uniref:Glycosyltransferase family 4 protein n=1 Tax=Fulvivirga marina TaxID=2494733 RepID=A0A937FTY2_9BACT|nr:glycosyltransferase family 4 protein [Fulvivirga marina]MBL6444772.1 glycosyltransferase family 4 protein [Fulvivirga marina]